MKKNKPLRILKTTEYKGFYILVQQIIPENMFQFILFKEGKFYQGFNIITPANGRKKHSRDDLIKCAGLMLDYAFTTVDVLLAKDNPDELLKKNQNGAAVLEVLENVSKKDSAKSLSN